MRRVQSRILYEQMLGRATRLCPEINKSVFHIYDAVGIYDAMNAVTNMKPVVKDPHHDVHYFIEHKHDFFEANDSANTTQYRLDMAGAIDRKVKRLGETSRKKFESLTRINSIDRWAGSLSHLNKSAFLMQWQNFEQLDHIRPARPKQYISHAPDEYIGTIRGYGKENHAPKDYIESFNKFIKENANTIPALQIVTIRPKDLTFDELKDIKLKLEQNGFKESDLQSAWKEANHVQTAADIISFIRQAANGSKLVDHDVRIHNAMEKVYGMANWNIVQMKWLKRIEKQLLRNTVLAPNAKEVFNNQEFGFNEYGGYKKMKAIFGKNTDQIIYVLNNNLYV